MHRVATRSRYTLPLILAAVLTAGLPWTGQPALGQASRSTVILAVNPDWRTMDPGSAYEIHAQLVMRAIYDTLVRVAAGKIQPWLAESWTVSDSGTEYTFRLRGDVRFTTKNPLTSEDVAFSFLRLKYLKGHPAFLAGNIQAVETPDRRTVKVVLNEPEGAFLSKLSQSPFSVVDSRLVRANGGTDAADAKDVDKARDWLDKNSVGSGPYVLRKFALREETILERNPAFWGPAPQVERLVFKEIRDSNTQALLLQRGDIDVALALTRDQTPQLQNAPGVKLVTGNTLNIFFLLMNQDPVIAGPFADERVRRAVRSAINYGELRSLFGLNAVTPFNIIPVGFAGALGPNQRTTDLVRARRLLAEAGYANGFDFKMEVSSLTVTGVNFITAAEKIQADLAKVGIRITLEPNELAVGLPRYRAGQQGFSLWMWGPDYADAANQLAFLPGEKVGLRANWKAEHDPDLNRLGRRVVAESNQTRRIQLLQQIQRRLFDYGPWAVFLQPGEVQGFRTNVEATYTPMYKLELDSLVKR